MRPLGYGLALALGLAGAHLVDLDQRASAVRQFTWSQAPDLERIARYEPAGVEACALRDRGDREALVRALMTVESFATPRIEAWWKMAIVHASALSGLPIPDLTYGPGRVRLSIAETVPRANGETSSPAVLALRLLGSCKAKRIVAELVTEILKSEQSGDQAHLGLETVRAVARIYNGQMEALTPEAAIAHETYAALVYALFQRYRFEGLGDTAPGDRLVSRR